MENVMVKRSGKGRIMLRYLPAIFFMLIGIFDIGAEIWSGKVNWYLMFFNLAFLLPIIFRKSKAVYITCGICFSLVWIYLLAASITVIPGNPRISAWQAIGLESLLVISLICSLMLVFQGMQKINAGNNTAAAA